MMSPWRRRRELAIVEVELTADYIVGEHLHRVLADNAALRRELSWPSRIIARAGQLLATHRSPVPSSTSPTGETPMATLADETYRGAPDPVAAFRMLHAENARLTGELADLKYQAGVSPGIRLALRGRYFPSRTIRTALAAFVLALGTIGWQWHRNAQAFDAGFKKGYAEQVHPGDIMHQAVPEGARVSFRPTPEGGVAKTIQRTVSANEKGEFPTDAAAGPVGAGTPTRTVEMKDGALTITTTWPLPPNYVTPKAAAKK